MRAARYCSLAEVPGAATTRTLNLRLFERILTTCPRPHSGGRAPAAFPPANRLCAALVYGRAAA
jgi:hypothetical protein